GPAPLPADAGSPTAPDAAAAAADSSADATAAPDAGAVISAPQDGGRPAADAAVMDGAGAPAVVDASSEVVLERRLGGGCGCEDTPGTGGPGMALFVVLLALLRLTMPSRRRRQLPLA